MRVLARMTLVDVAKAAGTSPSYLSNVETGTVVATETYIGRVAAAIASQLQEAA